MLINTLERPVTGIDYKRLITSSDELKMQKTEAMILLDWVRGGMELPQHVVTQALLITGDISPRALR